ncbi:MAG: hypothetical protein J3Q66DRAFT_409060 [Benniella sp.]|nr:MAG: hypothetical protein J3Q66DRAFT_409060 [Benniella sp.]
MANHQHHYHLRVTGPHPSVVNNSSSSSSSEKKPECTFYHCTGNHNQVPYDSLNLSNRLHVRHNHQDKTMFLKCLRTKRTICFKRDPTMGMKYVCYCQKRGFLSQAKLRDHFGTCERAAWFLSIAAGENQYIRFLDSDDSKDMADPGTTTTAAGAASTTGTKGTKGTKSTKGATGATGGTDVAAGAASTTGTKGTKSTKGATGATGGTDVAATAVTKYDGKERRGEQQAREVAVVELVKRAKQEPVEHVEIEKVERIVRDEQAGQTGQDTPSTTKDCIYSVLFLKNLQQQRLLLEQQGMLLKHIGQEFYK